MPAQWSAEVSVELDLDPELVFPYLNDLSKWDEWTTWSGINSSLTDPSHGAGAKREWKDEDFGSGSIIILESNSPKTLVYEVVIDDGARISGEFRLTQITGGTLITWRENGDLGRNPMMSYMANRIGGSQEKQMEAGLARLRIRVSG